jgi:hypothetical protein
MRRRRKSLLVRFTPEELHRIRERARYCGLPASTFLRELGLGAELRERPRRIEKDAIYHLSRLGNNLNQLTRAANATGRVELSERLREVLAELRAAIARLA